MIKKHIFQDDKDKIKTSPDVEDVRIFQPCERCGNSGKKIVSMILKDWTRSGIHREAHQLRCCNCNDLKCTLPFKLSPNEAGEFEMPFGKYKGRLLKDVPDDYLAWMQTQPKFEAISRKIRIMKSVK